jgi:hypothetical protein
MAETTRDVFASSTSVSLRSTFPVASLPPEALPAPPFSVAEPVSATPTGPSSTAVTLMVADAVPMLWPPFAVPSPSFSV